MGIQAGGIKQDVGNQSKSPAHSQPLCAIVIRSELQAQKSVCKHHVRKLTNFSNLQPLCAAVVVLQTLLSLAALHMRSILSANDHMLHEQQFVVAMCCTILCFCIIVLVFWQCCLGFLAMLSRFSGNAVYGFSIQDAAVLLVETHAWVQFFLCNTIAGIGFVQEDGAQAGVHTCRSLGASSLFAHTSQGRNCNICKFSSCKYFQTPGAAAHGSAHSQSWRACNGVALQAS